MPFPEGLVGALDGAFVFFGGGGADGGEELAVNGRKALERLAAAEPLAAKRARVVGLEAQLAEGGGWAGRSRLGLG